MDLEEVRCIDPGLVITVNRSRESERVSLGSCQERRKARARDTAGKAGTGCVVVIIGNVVGVRRRSTPYLPKRRVYGRRHDRVLEDDTSVVY
jgi:hypothetical protein